MMSTPITTHESPVCAPAGAVYFNLLRKELGALRGLAFAGFWIFILLPVVLQLVYGVIISSGQPGGADWLPFRQLAKIKTTRSGQKSHEVVWTNDDSGNEAQGAHP